VNYHYGTILPTILPTILRAQDGAPQPDSDTTRQPGDDKENTLKAYDDLDTVSRLSEAPRIFGQLLQKAGLLEEMGVSKLARVTVRHRGLGDSFVAGFN